MTYTPTIRLALALLALALPASAETWKNVMLLDVMCSKLPRVMRAATEHPRACILECHEDGYGVVLNNGDFLKFDEKGSHLALDILRSDNAPEQNVRVNVTGELKNGVLYVSDMRLNQRGVRR
jgi:hypothetical protein